MDVRQWESRRCPFRMKAFDQPDTCDPECAWLFELPNGGKACSVTALAANVALANKGLRRHLGER